MKYSLKSVNSFKDLKGDWRAKYFDFPKYIDVNCLNDIEKQMFDLRTYRLAMERHNLNQFGCNQTFMTIEAKARVLKFNWSIAAENLTFDMISGK